MKGVLCKRWLICALLGLMLYLLALALTAGLILRGVLGEEYANRGCVVSAFAAAFASAIVYRLSGKGDFPAAGILCGGAFLLPFLLAGAAFFDGLSIGKAAVSAASALLGAFAATVLFGRKKSQKKKRGKRRSSANR